jgi:hypothetical protein
MDRMQTPTDPAPTASPPEPGERRRLDRPPSERYADIPNPDATAEPAEPVAEPSATTRIARGAGVAFIGAAVLILLGGPLSVTAGLVAAAAVIGWLVGTTVRSAGPAVALALASVAVGLVGIWLFAQSEGGVLGIVEYLLDVHGPLVPIEFAAAGLLAAGSAR